MYYLSLTLTASVTFKQAQLQVKWPNLFSGRCNIGPCSQFEGGVARLSLSPYKVEVVPSLGKWAHSKLNDFSLFSAFLYIRVVFSSFITQCENPGKAAVLSQRGTLTVSLAQMDNGSF